MLARFTGRLESIAADRARVEVGPILVDVLVPGSDVEQLQASVGDVVTFHTLLVLESIGQGTSMVPRLIGFASPQDRAFFELFTTVKNIGHRKALRALQAPAVEIASAIGRRDTVFLVSLPEIGKRTAETIIAELSGKVDDWLASGAGSVAADLPPAGSAASDAVAMLVSLGERPDVAHQLVERVRLQHPDIDSPEELLAQVMAAR
ncbi:MAG: helix-hairpin-helix domain-containing protein [Phycisphaerales bacterium]|nr:helix-hairpin-helix domain-containing protein [Phycisphaerales bacterium]